jgi:type II secretory pathway pseudopilin PulG
MRMKTYCFSKGVSILEVVIGASILLILTTAIGGAWASFIVLTRISTEKTQAALIIEETADGIRFLRDKGWTVNIAPITLDTPHYLKWQNGKYEISADSTPVQGNFTRTVTFKSVMRNGQDDISSSGTIDTKTKKVIIGVHSNQTPQEVSVQSEMLIHDIYAN